MNFIERFIYVLQYEVDRPSSYGIFHITCLLISFALIIYLLKRKEKNHEKSLKMILAIYGFGALVLEILKQVVWSFNYESGLITWDMYDANICINNLNFSKKRQSQE